MSSDVRPPLTPRTTTTNSLSNYLAFVLSVHLPLKELLFSEIQRGDVFSFSYSFNTIHHSVLCRQCYKVIKVISHRTSQISTIALSHFAVTEPCVQRGLPSVHVFNFKCHDVSYYIWIFVYAVVRGNAPLVCIFLWDISGVTKKLWKNVSLCHFGRRRMKEAQEEAFPRALLLNLFNQILYLKIGNPNCEFVLLLIIHLIYQAALKVPLLGVNCDIIWFI